MATFVERARSAWNIFRAKGVENPFETYSNDIGPASYGYRPDRTRFFSTNDRSTIISSIYTRVAIDSASVDLWHIRLDSNRRFLETVNSGLQNCLTVEANPDQAASAFRQDAVATMLDKGVIAIVPVDTLPSSPGGAGGDILTLRVGEITQWYPYHVKVSIWNIEKQLRDEVLLPKSSVAIIENPLYAVMNETNSTLQRLIRKLNFLDAIDEQSSSGKLDIIMQLPYTIRSEARKEQAEKRRKDIEFQLKDSKYGVAYVDATEKITQLNRPAENNLLSQVQYLTEMVYAQLGITEEVLSGTASEEVMLNYYNRTVEPILRAIKEGMTRSFLSKTARTQGHDIQYFRDPFRLVPVSKMAEIADKFTRNEVLASNEVRGLIGFKPSADPKADQLINKNLPAPSEPVPGQQETELGD